MECAFNNTTVSVIKCPNFNQYPMLNEKKVLVLGWGGGWGWDKAFMDEGTLGLQMSDGSGGEYIERRYTCNTKVAKC